ncbi:(2Fe-2S)-binding protein [Desulforamulus aquiferis]|uniref:2Fe-2S iron-sulfur cluster-binding protein n=1 Tax=Desulforamulus aquiferis TaxID=1397668 RepID=A0AAW7ZEJ9_9FIRM|nr:2Fe-2S iron-sulfur cluster-binding protein [Desulforamulus aquiferis]MDO7787705.1 2Fe-2S iron-sulfur cluster-binding protein [Desulforamulus aquiferis]RYD03735.1 (2Fe-2S)-binding protein [Desulforamulus aquiferis]
MQISTIINNKEVFLEIKKGEFLVDTLRSYGLLSVRTGCDTTSCGLCTVWLDGKPTLSCSVLSARVQGKKVTTIEGVQKEAEEFAQFIASEGSDQCGYCSPGFIMTVLAMKRELTEPSEQQIIHYLTGNLCRCTGYMSQLRAVKRYLEVVQV